MIPHFDPAIGWYYTSPRISNERGLSRKLVTRSWVRGFSPRFGAVWNAYSMRVRIYHKVRRSWVFEVPW